MRDFKKNMMQYIMDCIESEEKTKREKVSFLKRTFCDEYKHEIKRKGVVSALESYFMALPACCTIEHRYYAIIELSEKMGFFPGNEDKQIENWFRHIACYTAELFRNLDYERTKLFDE